MCNMIQLVNGRIKCDSFYSELNCYIIIDNVEYPIYDFSNDNVKIEKQDNRAAIEGESFADGGAWTTYILTSKVQAIIKYSINIKSKDLELKTFMYFKQSETTDSCNINSYTIDVLSDEQDGTLCKRALVNGCVKYMGLKETMSKIKNVSTFDINDHKKILNVVKF